MTPMSPTWQPCPSGKHEPLRDPDPENIGGTWCGVCSVVLSGPQADEAREIGRLLGVKP